MGIRNPGYPQFQFLNYVVFVILACTVPSIAKEVLNYLAQDPNSPLLFYSFLKDAVRRSWKQYQKNTLLVDTSLLLIKSDD